MSLPGAANEVGSGPRPLCWHLLEGVFGQKNVSLVTYCSLLWITIVVYHLANKDEKLENQGRPPIFHRKIQEQNC